MFIDGWRNPDEKEHVRVKLLAILAVSVLRGKTVVSIAGDGYYVKQSPEEIEELVAQAHRAAVQ
jgi:hypothetical protein